jgi:hypothetical protein
MVEILISVVGSFGLGFATARDPACITDRVPIAKKSEATPAQVNFRPLEEACPARLSVTRGLITSVVRKLYVLPDPPIQGSEVVGVK